jgi:hypothetical protein
MEITRSQHIAWCKERALAELEAGNLDDAFLSMMSDLSKHSDAISPEIALLSTTLFTQGHLKTPEQMRHWIEGF